MWIYLIPSTTFQWQVSSLQLLIHLVFIYMYDVMCQLSYDIGEAYEKV